MRRFDGWIHRSKLKWIVWSSELLLGEPPPPADDADADANAGMANFFFFCDKIILFRSGEGGRGVDGVGAGSRSFEKPRRFPRRNSANFNLRSGRGISKAENNGKRIVLSSSKTRIPPQKHVLITKTRIHHQSKNDKKTS